MALLVTKQIDALNAFTWNFFDLSSVIIILLLQHLKYTRTLLTEISFLFDSPWVPFTLRSLSRSTVRLDVP